MNHRPIRRCRPLLGTYVEITVVSPADPPALHRWINEAFAAVAEVHRLMSFQDPQSELSRLNAGAHLQPLAVHAWTHEVLRAACELGRQSEGLFDIAAGGDGGSFRDIVLRDDGRVSFRRPLSLDLGGIAKGFAVDCAVDALARYAPAYACVNAGGDLRVWGDAPAEVAVRDPDRPRGPARLLPMTHAAVATSAGYFNGVIVHPGRGAAPARGRSVTVFAPTCLVADALTKVAWLAEPAVVEHLLEVYGAALFEWEAVPA